MCHDSFPTEQERNDHYVDIHRYCADCMRFFRNQNGILRLDHPTDGPGLWLT